MFSGAGMVSVWKSGWEVEEEVLVEDSTAAGGVVREGAMAEVKERVTVMKRVLMPSSKSKEYGDLKKNERLSLDSSVHVETSKKQFLEWVNWAAERA